MQSNNTLIQAIIFDMDGTLFDTEKIYFLVFLRALKEQGLSLEEEFYHANLAGTTNHSIECFFVEKFGDAFDLETYKNAWPDYLHEYIEKHGLPFMPEIPELLESLRGQGIPLAVASSSDLAEIEFFLKSSGIRNHFSILAAGDEVENSKPAPDIFLLAASRLEKPPETCLVIEDSNHGVKAAADAGMNVLMTPGLAGVSPVSKELAEVPESIYKRTLELAGLATLKAQ